MASLVLAYVLWFFFGIFGVHHFYLKRDRHAFVWWSTLGGVFGLGWIRDFWRLPSYVRQANGKREDGHVMNDKVLKRGARIESKPKLSQVRWAGMLMMGCLFSHLVMLAFPQHWFRTGRDVGWVRQKLSAAFLLVVPPYAAAVGVHLVASIGRVQASFWCCITGSLFMGVFIWKYSDPFSCTGVLCPLSSALVVHGFGLAWKPYRRPHESVCKRLSVLCVCGTVYLLLWGSALYFSATVRHRDRKEMPLRAVIHHFLMSPAWQNIQQNIQAAFWRHRFEWIRAPDREREPNPYEILGVSRWASQEQIKEEYKRLVLKWHPDKHEDPATKEKAHRMFIKIQNAFEILSTKRKRSHRRDEF